MTNETKQAYIDKMDAEFKVISARVDLIKAKVARGAADLKVDYTSQLANWHTKETEFVKELNAIRSSTLETFDHLKVGAQTAWQDLSKFASETFAEVKS